MLIFSRKGVVHTRESRPSSRLKKKLDACNRPGLRYISTEVTRRLSPLPAAFSPANVRQSAPGEHREHSIAYADGRHINAQECRHRLRENVGSRWAADPEPRSLRLE